MRANNKVKDGTSIRRMLDLAGAAVIGREAELGSVEVGKKADSIAVDRDLSGG